MKNVEPAGRPRARREVTTPGLSIISWIVFNTDEESVKTMKLCWVEKGQKVSSVYVKTATNQNLENEKARHQTQLETSSSRDSFEASEKAKDNGKQHVEHRKQYWREDALN
jgi:hypothetical protein